MNSDVAAKIDKQFSKCPKRLYPKGQILIFADENPEHIYYLVKGKVREYDVSYRGDEVIVNIFKPPAFFPMSWAVNRSGNRYFYKTEEETVVHVVPVEEALKFIKADADVLFDLLSRVYRGVDGLLGKVVQLMAGTAKSRLVYELIVESRRFGKKKEDGSCVLQVNEVDLAARSGLSRETVSREMQKIKEQGLVTIEHDGIVVKSLSDLEKMLASES